MMRRSKTIRRFAFACAVAFFSAFAAPSFAAEIDPDPDPPPVFAGTGQAGYDLITGSFTYSATEVVIGDPDAGGLAFSRTFLGSGWRDNYAGTINSNGNTYTVSIGSDSETFTFTAEVPPDPEFFTSDQAMGSTLTRVAAGPTYNYTYTLRDGTVAFFEGGLADGGAVFNANVARIKTLTRPNGEQITWHYKSTTAGLTGRRLQAVTNNLGYQIHFEYARDANPTTQVQLDDWRRLAKVIGFNMGAEYCSPTDNTCPTLSSTWPRVTYDVSPAGFYRVTDNLGQETQYLSDAFGLVAIRRPTSPNATNVTISYANGRVSQVTNTVGTWRYTYTTNGNVRTTTVLDPLNHTRVVVSNLTTMTITSDTNGTGNTTSYQYDGNRRLTRVTMPENNYTVYVYDSRGNITSTTVHNKADDDMIVTSASFDASCSNPRTCNQPNSTTDARGFQTDYTYNSTHGGVLTVTQPAACTSAPSGSLCLVRPQTRYSYTALNAYYIQSGGGSPTAAPSSVYRLTATSSCATSAWNGSACAAGNNDETVTTIGYGPQSAGTANNLLPVEVAAGARGAAPLSEIETSYDNVGNLEFVNGPLSGTTDLTRYYYDSVRRLTGVVGPDSGSSVYRAIRNTYNADGQITAVERGTVSSQSSNPWGSFSALWRQENLYNFVGQLTRETVFSSGTPRAVTQYSYDTAGRLDCTAQRMNPSTFASPEPSACVGAIVAQGVGADRITRNFYDNANRPTKVTLGYGSASPVDEWTATYTANGQLSTIADGGGNLTTYVYDGFDRTSRMRYPLAAGGGSSASDYEEMTYDDNGNVTVLRRRDATTLTNTYDNLNRVTTTDPSTAEPNIEFTYDLFNRLLTQRYTGGQILTFTYDQLGRNLTQQTTGLLGVGVAVGYHYDAAGRRTRMDWPAGPAPNDFFVTYDYNVYDEMTAIREKGAASGAGVLATYAYDNLGRRTSLTRGNGTTETLTYDASFNLGALAQNLSGSSHDETITLDHNGVGQIIGRTSSDADFQWTPIAPGTTGYTDNGLNQYTAVGGAGYTYDARGNLIDDGSRDYTYDIYNRLRTVTGAGAMTLGYDPAGRLYETVAGGTTTRFLYDGDEVIAEYNGSGTLQRRYVPGASFDEHLVWYEGATTGDRRYMAQDERGSVIATDASGGVTAYAYDEYGRPHAWGSPTSAPRFRYAGAVMLEQAQLYHMRARAYSPTLGRFLQTDPILFDGGMNLYGYVGNDPVNWTDPFGLETEEEIQRRCAADPGACEITVTGTPCRATVCLGSEALADYNLRNPHGERITETDSGEIIVTAERCMTYECQRRRWERDREWRNRTSVSLLAQACNFTWCVATPDPFGELRFAGMLGKACGCFVEGTMVATPDGLRPIEEIGVGDQVLAWNPETRETTAQTVAALIRPEPKQIWRIETLDVGGATEVFEVTEDHLWYVEGAGWIETRALQPGQRIETADDRGLTIHDIRPTDQVERTYNLTVTGPHTFLVGEDLAVVHNQNFCRLVGHHPWPKYLGGASRQNLYMLGERMHRAFHTGLDRIAPRFQGAQQLTAGLGRQVAGYMQRFDARYGTRTLDAARANGFPY